MGTRTCSDESSTAEVNHNPRFHVSHLGTALSGSVNVPSDINSLATNGCSLSCSQPGFCTLTCPDATCSIQCTPATPSCADHFDITGTAAASAVSFQFLENVVIDADCGQQGTAHVSGAASFDFQGNVSP